jgi:hypothetical protein
MQKKYFSFSPFLSIYCLQSHICFEKYGVNIEDFIFIYRPSEPCILAIFNPTFKFLKSYMKNSSLAAILILSAIFFVPQYIYFNFSMF